MTKLTVRGLQVELDHKAIVHNIDLEVSVGQWICIIGPNGAGKTTLFNIINGSIKPDSGNIKLNNLNITGYEPHQLFDLGILKSIPDIYDLDWSRISSLEGFGAKSISNLQQAIAQSKSQELNRLLFGLGIRYVGETTAKILANAIDTLQDLYNWTEEQLCTLEDVGPKVAASVAHFFQHTENRLLIEQLIEKGVSVDNKRKSTALIEGVFSGKSFLFTGTLTQLKRSEAEAMVEARGGHIVNGVSSKLNYLFKINFKGSVFFWDVNASAASIQEAQDRSNCPMDEIETRYGTWMKWGEVIW